MLSFFIKMCEPTFIGGIVFYFILLTILLLFLWRNHGFLAQVLLFFFLVCSSLIIADYFKPFFPQHNDSMTLYIPGAMKLADSWSKSIFNIGDIKIYELATSNPAYIYPLGVVFYFFADSLIAARLFSTIFGLLIIYELYYIAEYLFGTKTAKLTAFLIACEPYFWLMSCSILRDTHAVFFMLWFFRLWMLYEKRPNLNTKLLMVFSLLYAGMLRPPLMLVIILVIILSKTVFNVENRAIIAVRLIKLCIAAVIFAGIGIYALSNPALSNIRLIRGFNYADISTMTYRIEGSSEADSGYGQEFRYTSYTQALEYSPILIFYFMTAPLPWMVKKTSQVLALMDSAMLWVLYIFFFMEVKRFWRMHKKWAPIILAYLVLGITSAALIQGNMGAAVRHRLLFTVLILPVAANGIRRKFAKGREVRPLGRTFIPSPSGKVHGEWQASLTDAAQSKSRIVSPGLVDRR